MKPIFRFILLGMIFLNLLACSESKMLMKGLSSFPQPLGYDLISPIDTSVKSDSVIVTFSGFQLDSITSVHRKKGLLIPLIFVNYTDYDYGIKLGASQLKDDYNDFFFNALIDESMRSGRFALCSDSTRSKDVYNLEVRLDTCMTDTHLSESTLVIYYVYGYSLTYSENSYPANSKVTCSIKLRKGEQLIRDTTFSVSSTLEFIGGDNLDRNGRLERTASCLVAALCQSTRDCVSKMIQDVNGTIASQKR